MNSKKAKPAASSKATVYPPKQIEQYKGFRIETTANGAGHVSIVYSDLNLLIKCTVSDLVPNGKTSIDKAKQHIDSL